MAMLKLCSWQRPNPDWLASAPLSLIPRKTSGGNSEKGRTVLFDLERLSKMLKIMRACWVLVIALSLITPSAYAEGYSYKRIVVPGAVGTTPVALNNAGVVLGYWIDNQNLIHGFTYKNGTVTTFDHPSAQRTVPTGMNDGGVIIGYYITSNNSVFNFLYKNGRFSEITVPGAYNTTLSVINNNNIIAGIALSHEANDQSIQTLFTWNNGKVANIVSNSYPSPVAINVSGSIVGNYNPYPDSSAYHTSGFLYLNGVVTAIPIPDALSVSAAALNNANTVVGQIRAITFKLKSFIYKNGKLTEFDVPGWTNSYASSINNNGVVLGTVANKNNRSAIYVYDGSSFQFVSIPKHDVGSIQINDAGQILGYDSVDNETTNSFLATPEP